MLITWNIVSRKITQGRVFSRYAWNLASEIISLLTLSVSKEMISHARFHSLIKPAGLVFFRCDKAEVNLI